MSAEPATAASTALPAPATAASEAAVTASLANLSVSDDASAPTAKPEQAEELEEGEIREGAGEDAGTEDDDALRTVFDDATGFNVKHPLYNAWTLWFDNPAKKAAGGGGAHGWLDDIKEVISFDSVEEFWGLYNNILPPTHLPQKANYYLFKRGIRPAWEDPANAEGGKWSVQFPREKWRERIDQFWLNTMLAAIGETLELSPSEDVPELVTGVLISTRPNFFRLAIWTRQSTPTGASPSPAELAIQRRLEALGRLWKTDVLGFKEGQKLGGGLATEVEFVGHKEGEKKGRAKGRLTA